MKKIWRILGWMDVHTYVLPNHTRQKYFVNQWSWYCKVAGSNLTCRDDWISRWRLHSVGPTSTGLSSLGQNIIHSPHAVARVVYGWWALAYKLIQECQDRLKMCPIVQYGVSEAVSMKMPVFLCCLTLSGWFYCIGVLYSSIRVGSNL